MQYLSAIRDITDKIDADQPGRPGAYRKKLVPVSLSCFIMPGLSSLDISIAVIIGDGLGSIICNPAGRYSSWPFELQFSVL